MGVTLCCCWLSTTLQAVCDFCNKACLSVEEPTFRAMATRAFESLLAVIERPNDCLKGGPCFYVTFGMWIAEAVSNWVIFMQDREFPLAVYFVRTAIGSEKGRMVVSEDRLEMLYSNVILVAGLAAKASGVCNPTREAGTDNQELRNSSGGGRA